MATQNHFSSAISFRIRRSHGAKHDRATVALQLGTFPFAQHHVASHPTATPALPSPPLPSFPPPPPSSPSGKLSDLPSVGPTALPLSTPSIPCQILGNKEQIFKLIGERHLELFLGDEILRMLWHKYDIRHAWHSFVHTYIVHGTHLSMHGPGPYRVIRLKTRDVTDSIVNRYRWLSGGGGVADGRG